ncbi:MAG: YeeE/YedE family protein [Methylomonas sp.]|jgi:uncharacterized protein|nr:MAG: YeeE/YedE family protein [Methylomonas sp.]
MNILILALLSGLVFGLGLSLSQMVNPDKVLGFLDISGNWDPSLALVMAGALTIAMPGFHWIRRQPKPLLDNEFHLTPKNQLDKPLLFGAALFGTGWGMTGYCPGPAFANLALGNQEALYMVISIYAGFSAAGFFSRKN